MYPYTPTHAALKLHPRLARLDDLNRNATHRWITPGFSASTAYISLSPGLICVFDQPGREALNHQDIGALGLTAHQAWNAAAQTLRVTALRKDGVEFPARPAAVALGATCPPGLEVGGTGVPPAAWLAHPRTFTMLDAHFRCVLDHAGPLTYLSRDQQELFVFTADTEEVTSALGHRGVMRYSLGFPLLVHREAAVTART